MEYINFDVEVTEYKCPHCQKGYLKRDSFYEKQYLSSIKKGTSIINEDGEEEYDDSYYLGNILGFLKCPFCDELTSFVGETKYYLNYYDEIEVLEKGIFFKYFVPQIHIIELKNEYPEELKEILLESFSLYFSSYSACVNTLRILLEKLCELYEIKSIQDNGKYKSLNNKLKELKELGKISDDTIEFLEAIKWIGNDGSHSLEIINKEHLDLAYRFVKKVLDEIYPSQDDSEELKFLAKEINKNKGLVKKA